LWRLRHITGKVSGLFLWGGEEMVTVDMKEGSITRFRRHVGVLPTGRNDSLHIT
jgi:hypothetical protein